VSVSRPLFHFMEVNVQICKLDQVIIKDNRQRQDFDPVGLMELDTSIGTFGLFHLPICRREDGNIVLVSGERRLRVMQERFKSGVTTKHGEQEIELGSLWYTDIGELNPLEAEEAELEENIRRIDLSWQEEAVAHDRLHKLRSTQAHARGETQSLSSTAAEIKGKPNGTNMGNAVTELSQNIILAKHLDNPEVAKAKSAKEAMKVVVKLAEGEKRAQLAREFDLEFDPSKNPLRSLPHELQIGDSLILMQGLPDNAYTVMVTDPPYGIGADQFGDQSGEGHEYQDSYEFFQKFTPVLAEQSFRFCTPLAHAYVFCDPRRFAELELQFTIAGWKVWPTPLIWVKNQGMLPRPDHGPRRCYETIMFASKGDRKVRRLASDVLTFPVVRGLLHGAQKPVAVIQDLLSRSADPGDRVVDPFCGTGTIFCASNVMRLRATGFEQSQSYGDTAKLRMLRMDDWLTDKDAEKANVDVADQLLGGDIVATVGGSHPQNGGQV
jgi:DNA modification methylase